GAAGIWTGTTAVLPGQPGGPGTHVTAEVRVWDNAGGTITDWRTAYAIALADGRCLATSGLFGIDNIGGGTATTPNLINLQSFSIYALECPEPGTIALGFGGGLIFLLLRRRNR